MSSTWRRGWDRLPHPKISNEIKNLVARLMKNGSRFDTTNATRRTGMLAHLRKTGELMDLLSFVPGWDIVKFLLKIITLIVTIYLWQTTNEGWKKFWLSASGLIVLVILITFYMIYNEAFDKKDREIQGTCNIMSYTYNKSKCEGLKK
jgi:hypothetical protein